VQKTIQSERGVVKAKIKRGKRFFSTISRGLTKNRRIRKTLFVNRREKRCREGGMPAGNKRAKQSGLGL
jgi:hypothetical protein